MELATRISICNSGVIKHKYKFHLSVCIPTYNRSSELEAVLNSLVAQQEFRQGTVQICVADNASPDNTQSIVENFRKAYPSQIKYFRQSTNVAEGNFKTVLEMGDGYYLKINNDTLIHHNGSLAYMINEILDTPAHEALFFNGRVNFKSAGIDEFMSGISFHVTWIGGFGIFGDDKPLLVSATSSSKNLWQVEMALQLVSTKIMARVRRPLFTRTLYAEPKGPYDFNEIFINQYLTILDLLYRKKQVSDRVYGYLKRDVLLTFCSTWAASTFLRLNSNFKYRSHFEYLFSWYRTSPHLLVFYLCLIGVKIIRLAPKKFLLLFFKDFINKR